MFTLRPAPPSLLYILHLASSLPYYLDTWQLRTPAAVLPRYAPPGDGNVPAAYAASVIQLIDGWSASP